MSQEGRPTILFVVATCFSTLISGCGGCQQNAPPTAAPPPTNAAAAPDFTPELIAEHNRGVAHMGKFEFAEAQTIFADLAKRYPNWSDVNVDLAIATFNQQKPDESFASQYIVDSLAILDGVLKRDPEQLRARYAKGVLLYYLGKTAEAQPHFEFVAAKDPSDAFAAYFVGRCLFNDGKFEEALARYQEAIKLDPYFSSAYYAAFQTQQRLKRMEEARTTMADFQRLEGNPQARKEAMKYTRMGEKAEVLSIAHSGASPALTAGHYFTSNVAIRAGEGIRWRSADDERLPRCSVTAVDLDGNGRLDLYLGSAIDGGDGLPGAALLDDGPDALRADAAHPLAAVTNVSAAVWGDFDNDGLVDALLCRRGANQLWRQTTQGQWQDVTASIGASLGEGNFVDGLMVDIDHDGDLDLIALEASGRRIILANNRDGTFRDITTELGVTATSLPAADAGDFTQILAADFDRDRDVDLAFLAESSPPEFFANERLWSFQPAAGFEALRAEPPSRAVALDADNDGQPEIYGLRGDRLVRWRLSDAGQWTAEELGSIKSGAMREPVRLAAGDLSGDAVWEIVVADADGWGVADASRNRVHAFEREENLLACSVIPLDGLRPSLVRLENRDGALALRARTRNDRPYIAFTFSGKEEKQDDMRSNRSGIGVKVNARIGDRWFSAETFRNDSGPGQSLMPLSFGTAGADKVDFVMLHWSDGVFQTEMDLAANQLHHIEETQRQTSSCPLLFVWDGEKYAFVTDLLGVGGIGFNIGRGEYPPPDPTENLLLPDNLAQPRDGRLVLKLHEPMEEVTYLDHARLAVYDLPPGWQMALDERFGASDPQPTGEPIFYRREQLPNRVVNDRGEDVTATVVAVDDVAAPPNARDTRFIGRTQPSTLEMQFDAPLDANAVLIADGWVEYPYSQTMFAAWQAGAKYEPPTLEARGPDGAWQTVHAQFGYPAGMPRRMALPLPQLPSGTTALRISTTYEVYWDRLAVAYAEECPDAQRTILEPQVAELARTGFPERTNGPQRRPYYDYARRAPFDDMRHQSGWYTAFGDVGPLVQRADDALAIFGPGEEVHLEFAAPAAPRAGWTRRLVLETVGWCKDMDLLTADGDTVAPLPARDPETNASRTPLHNRHNTRYESGP